MAITAEQYRTLRKQGLTKDQILEQINSGPVPADVPTPVASGRRTDATLEFGTGALKGALKSTTGAVDLVKKGLEGISRPITKFVTGKEPKPATPGLQQILPEKAITPTNKTQQAGFVTEQIAEYFLPGGITKNVRNAVKLSTAPDLVKIIARGGIGAAEVTPITAAQGGTGEDIAGAGILGAGFDVVSGTLGKIMKTKTAQQALSYLTENVPSRWVNSILKPQNKEFVFGRNPGLGVIEEGITANTRGDLLIKIGEKKQQVWQEAESLMANPAVSSKVIDITSALKPIDDAINLSVKRGEGELVKRLQELRKGLTQEFQLVGSEVVETGSKNLKMNPKGVQEFKSDVGQSTRWTGQAFDADLNKVKVQVYRNLDSMLDAAVPGIDKINSRYANLLSAEKALERTDKNIQRLVMAGLRVSAFGGAGYFSSVGTGDSQLEAILKGAAFAGGFKLAGSTPAKTRAAKVLNSMKPSDRDALFELVPTLRNIISGLREKGEETEHEDEAAK